MTLSRLVDLPTDLEKDLATLGLAPPWPAIGDRGGWAELRRAIFRALPPDRSGDGRKLWDAVKAARAREAFEPKPWEEALPPGTRAWAEATLRAAIAANGDPCVDNECVACVDTPSGQRRFAKSQARGCCGREVWSEVGPDGRTYKFNFNYGH